MSRLKRIIRYFEKEFITLNNIEISRSALLHNCDCIKQNNSDKNIIPILKSNAYGCGLTQVAEILKARNFPYIAVDGFFEALRVRSVSKQPILVMGYIDPRNFEKIQFDDFAFVIHDEATVKALGSIHTDIKIHIEINTGMNRHGIQPTYLKNFIELINSYPNLHIDGVMSHLADADNKDNSYSLMQQEIFENCIRELFSLGIHPKYIHLAQTAGSTKITSQYCNTIRLGIGLYGINPLVHSDDQYSILANLQPVLTLKSTITKIIDIQAGEKVSYNGIFTATRPSKIGILPLGYYEGVPRALSNSGLVGYKDGYVPIVGRICMNHMMIDITESDAAIGDTITIISADPQAKNSLTALCHNYNLFVYEVLVKLSESVRRRVV